MRRVRSTTMLAAVTAAAVGIAVAPGSATAAPPERDTASPGTTTVSARSDAAKAGSKDDLPSPQSEQQRADRQQAIGDVLAGRAKVETRGTSKVTRNKDGRYVQLSQERSDAIFTILSDFGTKTDYTFTGKDENGNPVSLATGGTAGPVHNTIAEPDRLWDGGATDDNSTLWRKDFSPAHYQDMFFGSGQESFKDFYEKQSSGRYSVTGDVSDWVQVPYNESRYGRNAPSSWDTVAANDLEGSGYWAFVQDTVNAWYAKQKAAGQSDAQIKAYLAQFDKWDRYDYDHDGNFDEPDGYIDHFQAIHAGEGEEAGGGDQGADAIWSHRWYAFPTDKGRTGPTGNLNGGTQIGDTGLWVGDYTTEPENGGLGVFAHEFGHDLGLPDLYDTAGGDNGTGFWTLMSGGSWLNHGTEDIGSTPGYMAAWEKYQLGWLDAKVVQYGKGVKGQRLGIAEATSRTAPQGIVVNLPEKQVTTTYPTPASGSKQWFGGNADNLENTLTRDVDLTGTTSPVLSFATSYFTESGYDFAYVDVSADGGQSWESPWKVTGDSKGWQTVTLDLAKYAGKKVTLRFRYSTDGGYTERGIVVDDIALKDGATTLFTSGAENAPEGWTANGWTAVGASETKSYPQAYFLENRQYAGYDTTLRTGPYNFGEPYTQPSWVERFPYQNGLLVSYWDGSQKNNNTAVHPGAGRVLQVDAFSDPVVFPNGKKLGNRRQPFDATFGLERTDAVTFHRQDLVGGQPVTSSVTVPSRQMQATFDDSDPNRYWSALNPWSSVKVAGTGTSVTVTKSQQGGQELVLDIGFRQP